MAATYSPSLPTAKDWVRFLIGDTDTTASLLDDQEILAVIAEEENKYLAAASCLESLLVRWSSSGRGIVEKQASKLRIKRGVDQSSVAALEEAIARLRATGNRGVAAPSAVFRTLGA